ncbi:hypothetical protein UFOVP1655_123 [uncultured Caudovirales phage]|jgi:hypothetical protein|uniref:Uncharacterized protein n=1 Tax=uncultured Caudovirales phage TaxID=2100421 RepID=A0A6J5T6L3_9CAUD|nr:hypothetical protein UFOVP1655_123 [uncultured Caudovirales phage]
MKPLTERQKVIIVNNIVSATKDIKNLTNSGYNFIYLASGFIAHYNLYGFRDNYTGKTLKEDIISNKNSNMWNNFRPHESNYDYYMSKKDVYVRILEQI